MNFLTILALLGLIVLLMLSIVITRQKTLKHIVLLGKYSHTAKPGLSFKWPIVSWVDKISETNIVELEVPLRLKTQDQVTFSIALKVFYKISDDIREAYKAAYNLDDYERQIVSVATDSAIPVANQVRLEDVFDSKEKITDEATAALTAYFSNYGIEIERVVSDEPQLPVEVEEAANAVIASRRLNEAAEFKAKAIRTEKVGEAKADAESVKIRMEEVGKARKEYASTTAEAVEQLKETGLDPVSAINFLSRVGEQDAVVTASRNCDTAILSVGNGAQYEQTVPMIKALGNQQ